MSLGLSPRLRQNGERPEGHSIGVAPTLFSSRRDLVDSVKGLSSQRFFFLIYGDLLFHFLPEFPL